MSNRRASEVLENEGAYLYLLAAADEYKVGITGNLDRRLKAINGYDHPVFLAFFDKRSDATRIEAHIKARFKSFRSGASTEWFHLVSEDVAYIKQHALLGGGVSRHCDRAYYLPKSYRNIMSIINRYESRGESNDDE